MSSKLLVLTKNWARHGKHSGYERLINYITVPIKLNKKLFLPYRVSSYFSKKTQLKNYKSHTVIKEWIILIQIFKKKRIHILYGDMDYYYLHYLKFFPFNLRRNTLIATFHHPPYELENRLHYNRKKVLGVLDKIIVMGPNQIPFLKQYTNADIKFIPHGINTKYFNYNSEDIRLNRLLIIGVSHRDHTRNIKIIKAVNTLIETTFTVIVPKEFASIYENINNVNVITDAVSDETLLDYYQHSKGLLLSLLDCTASNSILEALACGCPLIVNNVGAVRNYIPKECGLPVFEGDEVIESAEYISKLVSDVSYSKKVGDLQRQLAKNYDWKHIAKTTEDFILS